VPYDVLQKQMPVVFPAAVQSVPAAHHAQESGR
jgi:hypothetical protein